MYDLNSEITAQVEKAKIELLKKHGGKVTLEALFSAVMTLQVLQLQQIKYLGEIMSDQSTQQTSIDAVTSALIQLDTTLGNEIPVLTTAITNIDAEIANLKTQGVDTTALQAEVTKFQTTAANLVTAVANVAAVAPAAPTPVSTGGTTPPPAVPTAALDPDNQKPLYTFASNAPSGYTAVTDFVGDNNVPLYTFDADVVGSPATGEADAVYTGTVDAAPVVGS